jgi:hypothetical protein
MAVSRPVLFVPGFPGTDLEREFPGGNRQKIFARVTLLTQPGTKADVLPRLRGPADPDAADGVVPVQPIRRAIRLFDLVDLAQQAESLYGVLDAIGYDTRRKNDLFCPFGWDWRRPVDATATQTALAAELARLHERSGREVVALVHSTGGLVLRALLEAQPALAQHLHAIVAFGVPWAGTLRSAAFLAGQAGFGPLTAAEAHEVMVRAWAAYDLLPPAPAVNDLKLIVDPADHPVDLLAGLTWIPPAARADATPRAARARARHNARTSAWEGGPPVPLWNVVGWGAATVRRAELGPAGDPRGIAFPVVVDDLGVGDQDGDGTVPRRSAAWLSGPGVRTFELPVGVFPGLDSANRHGTLWKNPGGQDVLWHVLAEELLPTQVHAVLDPGDAAAPGADLRLRACAWDLDGTALSGASVEVLSPLNGQVLAGAVIPAGRAILTVPRGVLPKTSDGRFRRYRVRFRWTGGEAVSPDYLVGE